MGAFAESRWLVPRVFSVARTDEMVGDNLLWPGLSSLKVPLLPGEDRTSHCVD